jgi:hypothetical protein
MLQVGATRTPQLSSEGMGIDMRSLPKSSLLIELQQNGAGLIADVVILIIFLVLLAIH